MINSDLFTGRIWLIRMVHVATLIKVERVAKSSESHQTPQILNTIDLALDSATWRGSTPISAQAIQPPPTLGRRMSNGETKMRAKPYPVKRPPVETPIGMIEASRTKTLDQFTTKDGDD